MDAKTVGLPASHRLAAALGLALVLASAGSASAFQGTPEQRRACTPDVYRLCPGEIPKDRSITACMKSPGCRAAMDQNGY